VLGRYDMSRQVLDRDVDVPRRGKLRRLVPHLRLSQRALDLVQPAQLLQFGIDRGQLRRARGATQSFEVAHASVDFGEQDKNTGAQGRGRDGEIRLFAPNVGADC
jgi:hypothetical protein